LLAEKSVPAGITLTEVLPGGSFDFGIQGFIQKLVKQAMEDFAVHRVS
jgi:hypothetical protein